MRDKSPKKVSDAFQKWIKNSNLEKDSISIKIKENWEEIAGTTIANYTHKLGVYLPIIYITVKNSALRELLHNEKHLLIEKINEYLDADLVNEIRLS